MNLNLYERNNFLIEAFSPMLLNPKLSSTSNLQLTLQPQTSYLNLESFQP